MKQCEMLVGFPSHRCKNDVLCYDDEEAMYLCHYHYKQLRDKRVNYARNNGKEAKKTCVRRDGFQGEILL